MRSAAARFSAPGRSSRTTASKKTWKYKGKKRALARGHYRWYVYPGLGKRTANKYGPLIGSSDFFVKKR